jgi:hypothetical protein
LAALATTTLASTQTGLQEFDASKHNLIPSPELLEEMRAILRSSPGAAQNLAERPFPVNRR